MKTVTDDRPNGAVWRVVAERELRDLWLAGRALPLMFAYTVLLGATSYLAASNRALNFSSNARRSASPCRWLSRSAH